MTKGRKPLPTSIKKLRGNPGKRPLNKLEPRLGQVTGMPRGRLSAGAKRFWRKFAPGLDQAGVLTNADLPAFEMMAHHFDLAIQARKILEDKGLVTMGPKGGLVKHPAAQIFRDNSIALLRYAAEFGMTPSARSRIKTSEKEDGKKSLAEILFESIQTEDED